MVGNWGPDLGLEKGVQTSDPEECLSERICAETQVPSMLVTRPRMLAALLVIRC